MIDTIAESAGQKFERITLSLSVSDTAWENRNGIADFRVFFARSTHYRSNGEDDYGETGEKMTPTTVGDRQS